MQKIILTELQKKLLSNHAEEEKPNESCAILFGTENEEKIKVEKVFLTKNMEESPVNFTISPEQRLEADKIERESGLKIVGVFHSHPEGCEIEFYVDFEFNSRLLQSVIETLFTEAVKRMVRAFEARADSLYGSKNL